MLSSLKHLEAKARFVFVDGGARWTPSVGKRAAPLNWLRYLWTNSICIPPTVASKPTVASNLLNWSSRTGRLNALFSLTVTPRSKTTLCLRFMSSLVRAERFMRNALRRHPFRHKLAFSLPLDAHRQCVVNKFRGICWRVATRTETGDVQVLTLTAERSKTFSEAHVDQKLFQDPIAWHAQFVQVSLPSMSDKSKAGPPGQTRDA